jgi:hypothetical protein
MPKEVRYMLFSNEELYQALTNDLRARAHPVPRGYLKNIQIGSPEHPNVTLVYVNDRSVESSIRFEEQEILRALIVYCGYCHIPLSAKSVKTVEVKDGAIGLLCKLNFNSDKVTTGGGKVSYQDEHSERMKETAKAAATNTTTARFAARASTPTKSS